MSSGVIIGLLIAAMIGVPVVVYTVTNFLGAGVQKGVERITRRPDSDFDRYTKG